MKLKEKVQEILNSHNLDVIIPEEYKNVYEYKRAEPNIVKKEFEHETLNDIVLQNKYKKYIPKGWYGFDIGNLTPKIWFTVIDKILELLTDNDPNFEIHQIKMKFGGIKFYCESTIIEDLDNIELLIEDKLYDKKLKY